MSNLSQNTAFTPKMSKQEIEENRVEKEIFYNILLPNYNIIGSEGQLRILQNLVKMAKRDLKEVQHIREVNEKLNEKMDYFRAHGKMPEQELSTSKKQKNKYSKRVRHK